MSGLKAGNGTAKALIRLRVILAGEGVVRDERDVFRATLPGDGTFVEIDDRAGVTRIQAKDVISSSTKIDLSIEADFISFMHGVDRSMAGAGRIPLCLLGLSDEYARVWAEGNHALGTTVSDGNIDLPVRDGKWMPGPAFRGLAEAARWTQDKHLSEVAEDAVCFAQGKVRSFPEFSDAESHVRWMDLIERWASKDAVTYPFESGAWTEIKTRSGLVSATRKIGRGLADVLTGEDGTRLAFGKLAAYAHRDEKDAVDAVGVVNDGHLIVYAGSWAKSLDAAADELRLQTCTAENPRP